MMTKIRRALISVSDKSGLLPFVQQLSAAGVEMISTGGTARAIREAGFEVIELSDYTGFPEMLDGRVKTLHPKVHGGLLYLRDNPEHCDTVKEHAINPIDLVVVNLYPFEATIAKPDVTLEEAIENIDIGGPSMLRSAAKNHQSVTVVVDPADYQQVGEAIAQDGATSLALRRSLAARVYAHTAAYDAAIANHLQQAFDQLSEDEGAASATPGRVLIHAAKAQELRYGENPHQQAALYGDFNRFFEQLHGKALSYNNILDLTAAQSLIGEFEGHAATLAILKHTNPCGVGQGDNLLEAWDKAFATDKQAPFGGIIACNAPLDGPCAQAIAGIFSEVIVAPSFTDEAMEILGKKKNLRLIKANQAQIQQGWQVRAVGAGSYLAQSFDQKMIDASQVKVVTDRSPSASEWEALLFGWRVVKHVKSNAIVYAGSQQTLGVGAGQMSRVDASRIAVWKAGEAGLSLDGSVVCSDAFFPFADGLVAAAEAGATAAIQPGGSVRDDEVIAAANERGLAMVMTGNRHFRH